MSNVLQLIIKTFHFQRGRIDELEAKEQYMSEQIDRLTAAVAKLGEVAVAARQREADLRAEIASHPSPDDLAALHQQLTDQAGKLADLASDNDKIDALTAQINAHIDALAPQA